jgi:hypothetical protein
MLSVPIVAIVLLGVSFAFGLWARAYGVGLRIGTALWIVLTSLASPVLLFIGLTYICAIQNGYSGHYVCGL